MLLTALDLVSLLVGELRQGEPLPQAMQRVHLALARNDLDVAAWHVIQARMWDEMGVSDLAIIHEELAVEDGSSQSITVEVSRAMRVSKNLARLIRPRAEETLEGL